MTTMKADKADKNVPEADCADKYLPDQPSKHCMVFENAWDDETCWGPWGEWISYCEKDWNKSCQEVHDDWYAQDYNWLTPVSVPSNCWISQEPRTMECEMTIATLISQCHSLY